MENSQISKAQVLQQIIEKLKSYDKKNTDLVYDDIKNLLKEKTSELPKQINLSLNERTNKKKVVINRFGKTIKELLINTKKDLECGIKKYLIFPLYKGSLIKVRSLSEIMKNKENSIFLEEGLDLTKFDSNIFQNLLKYNKQDDINSLYLKDYNNLTVNKFTYFPFLKNNNIKYNLVYNNGDIYTQVEEEGSKFEVLVRKFFLYGKRSFKLFIGPEKIGKTSLIHQIFHHNYHYEKPNLGYCYIDLSLFFNKEINLEKIYIFLNDFYFMFFSHEDFISFIKDYSYYLSYDDLSNVFIMIKKNN